MSVLGRIHSFESCGTVDGPGIRFITFFQGCLMRCLYCHNRDTWDTHGGKEVTVEDLPHPAVRQSYKLSLFVTGSAPAKKKAFIPVWTPTVLFVVTIR